VTAASADKIPREVTLRILLQREMTGVAVFFARHVDTPSGLTEQVDLARTPKFPGLLPKLGNEFALMAYRLQEGFGALICLSTCSVLTDEIVQIRHVRIQEQTEFKPSRPSHRALDHDDIGRVVRGPDAQAQMGADFDGHAADDSAAVIMHIHNAALAHELSTAVKHLP
jgi:hypothetical protein